MHLMCKHMLFAGKLFFIDNSDTVWALRVLDFATEQVTTLASHPYRTVSSGAAVPQSPNGELLEGLPVCISPLPLGSRASEGQS